MSLIQSLNGWTVFYRWGKIAAYCLAATLSGALATAGFHFLAGEPQQWSHIFRGAFIAAASMFMGLLANAFKPPIPIAPFPQIDATKIQPKDSIGE